MLLWDFARSALGTASGRLPAAPRNFAPGSLSVAYSGIKFFFTFTEPRDWQVLKKLRLPKQKTLPAVMTIPEVHCLIGAVRQPRNAAHFWTVYSLGLRLEEGLHLQVGDLDSKRMLVHIHRGKGAKDRYLPLPMSTLEMLRRYWLTHRNPTLLFPAIGRNKQQAGTTTRPMDATTVQGCIKQIVAELGFQKKISTHTLRHSVATHLFEAGVSLVWIQKFLGHSTLLVSYFLVTFTVPEALRRIVRANQRVCYQAIFDAGSDTIRELASGSRFIGTDRIGFFGALHTWGRDFTVYHPHVHFVVPGGGVSQDGSRWQAGPAQGSRTRRVSGKIFEKRPRETSPRRRVPSRCALGMPNAKNRVRTDQIGLLEQRI